MQTTNQSRNYCTNRVSAAATGGPGTNRSKRKQDEVNAENDSSSNAIAIATRIDKKEIQSILSERLFSKEPPVVCVAMEKLFDLLRDTSDNAEHNRKVAYACGAPLAIVQAMKESQNSGYAASVRANGCFCLVCIGIVEGWQWVILGVGGLQACLDALDQHPGTSVQVSGLYLIGVLWDCRNVCKAVFDEGGLTAIMKAMKNHKQNSNVQWNGCYALQALIFVDTESTWTKAAVDAGGIEAVIEAMGNHPHEVQLQINACMFLTTLAKNHEDSRKRILQAKGLGPIGEALRIHEDNGIVVAHAREANSAIIGA